MRECYYTRRDVFLGGLTIGAALAGGLLFTSSSQRAQGADAARSRDNHLQLALPWNGLDFTWLPDHRLAIAGASSLGIVEASNGQLNWQKWSQIDAPSLQNSAPGTRAIYWSSDGTKVMYVTATTFLVLDVLSGQTLWSHHTDQATASIAALSPDGIHLALSQSPSASTTSHPTTNMQIWNVQEGKLVAQFGEHSTLPLAVKSILWSPDNTRIATTSLGGTVQVWRASDGQQLWPPIDRPTAELQQAISWSPDGSTIAFVSSGTNGQAQLGLWDARSGQLHFQTPALVGFLTDQLWRDNQVAWSPDGTRISFSVQTRDGLFIEVWSVQSRQRLFTCQPVNGQSTASAWSPDGKYLAAGQTVVGSGELVRGDNGERSIIQFWDAHNGHALFAYNAPKSPQRLSWSPNSRFLAIITPRAYGALANSDCFSFCRYGYNDYALEVFRVA